MDLNKQSLLLHNKKSLTKIWHQLPVDYYDQGIAKNFLQKIWHQHKINVFYQIISPKHINSILDLGCASGVMTAHIAKIFPKAQVTGTDVYSKIITYAKKKYPYINFVTADAHKLPFVDNYFDLVVCYETIEHVLDPKKVLLEIQRILKKNSRAVIAMDSGSLLFRLVWLIWERFTGKVWKNAHLHPYNHKELENLIKSTNLKIIEKKFSHFGMEVIFVLKK